MTAAAGRERRGTRRADSVPWRRLTWVAWRLHRAALTAFVVLISLVAIFMATTGFPLHATGPNVYAVGPNSLWRLFDVTNTLLMLMLPLIPALAGMFFGAPLIAREIETGTARFTWAQGAGRTRWLVATVVPVAVLLAVIAVGLGLEYRWWATFVARSPDRFWLSSLFSLNPLPYAGWIVLGFSLGLFYGAMIRRTVPAMAATLASYVPLMYAAAYWRPVYLPPLHMAGEQPTFTANGYGYGLYFGRQPGPRPDILSTAPGWPDGRLLSTAQLDHSPAWFRLHHIQVWLTYQPGNRFLLFQYIELGWLIVLSAILTAAAALVLIRRRAA
jgi:hypothetical protein